MTVEVVTGDLVPSLHRVSEDFAARPCSRAFSERRRYTCEHFDILSPFYVTVAISLVKLKCCVMLYFTD